MHIGVSRERTPFSALNFRSGAYNFHKFPTTKNPFRIFGRIGDIIFKISLISTRSSPPTACSAPFGSHSGDSHFHAQNGSSSFRSPTFSRSTGSPFRSPCPFFTLPRHIPIKMWGEYPPPPPPPGVRGTSGLG